MGRRNHAPSRKVVRRGFQQRVLAGTIEEYHDRIIVPELKRIRREKWILAIVLAAHVAFTLVSLWL